MFIATNETRRAVSVVIYGCIENAQMGYALYLCIGDRRLDLLSNDSQWDVYRNRPECFDMTVYTVITEGQQSLYPNLCERSSSTTQYRKIQSNRTLRLDDELGWEMLHLCVSTQPSCQHRKRMSLQYSRRRTSFSLHRVSTRELNHRLSRARL